MSVSSNMGRPPKFKTPAALEAKVDEYFKHIEEKEKPPTAAGLALYLGFCDRASMYDQRDRGDDFSRVYKKAITSIERFHEEMLSTKAVPTGSIFWMKCHQWRDNQETSTDKQVLDKLDSVLNKIDGNV